MATDHWFDITAARRDIAYHLLMTVAEGVKNLVAHYGLGMHVDESRPAATKDQLT